MWFLALFSIAIVVNAAVPPEVLPSDVSVTLSASPDFGLAVDEIVHLQLSVTNNGPVVLNNVIVFSSHFYDQFDLGKSSNDCLMTFVVDDDGTPFSYLHIWYATQYADLAVGETRTCHIQMALSPRAPPVTSLTFGLPYFYLDPDPTNDRQTVFLHRALDSIPTASPMTLLALAGLLAVSAMAALRVCRSPLRGPLGLKL